MKRIFALISTVALLLCLCACGFIPEEVKEQAKEEIGDSFEQSLEDMKNDLKDFTVDEKIRLLAGKEFWHTEDFGDFILVHRSVVVADKGAHGNTA